MSTRAICLQEIIIFNLRGTTLVHTIKRARSRLFMRNVYIHIYVCYIYLSITVQREHCSSDTTFNRTIGEIGFKEDCESASVRMRYNVCMKETVVE